MKKTYWIYILTNKNNSTLYIGVTNNLSRRLEAHIQHKSSKFTSLYNVNKLIYAERYKYIFDAISREKQLKKWNRKKKENLVKTINPNWDDLRNSDIMVG